MLSFEDLTRLVKNRVQVFAATAPLFLFEAKTVLFSYVLFAAMI